MWEYRESIFGTTAHKAIDDLHISAYVAPFEGGYLSIVEAQDDESVFYHRERLLDSKREAEIDLNAQINFIDSLTTEDFRKVATGLLEWPNDYSEPYEVKYPHVKKAQEEEYLHGSPAIYEELKNPGSQIAIFFSPAKGRWKKTQAEYIAENRGYLYRASLAPGKRFDPWNDPQAANIVRRVVPAEARGKAIGVDGEWKESMVIPYYYARDVFLAAMPLGYNRFPIYEDSVNDFSEAVTDPSIISILSIDKITPEGGRERVRGSKQNHDDLAEIILKEHQANEGSTYTLDGRNLIGTPNFSVSLYPERSLILDRPLTVADLLNFIHRNSDLLKDTRNSIGTWFDKDGGKHYIDVVAIIPDQETAIELGKRFDQIAIFDLQKLVSIPTGGTGTGVGSENYPPEMHRLPVEEIIEPPSSPPPSSLPSPEKEEEEVKGAEESGVFDTHAPVSIQDPLPKNRYMGKKHNPKFEAETEKIKENREKPENQKPHPFKAAEWTHPNGHPRCIRCGDEEPVGGQCEGYKPDDGKRHFLAALEGYWINYHTGFEVKVAEHEDWVRNPNNAKSLGIPDSVIGAMPGIQFSAENRTKFLTFLVNNAPIMRVRGHGNQISFEYASYKSKEPLDAVWMWAKKNAGPYSTIYIANLATGENASLPFKDFEELMNTEGYEGIMRRGSADGDRIILGELITEFLVRQAGSTENYLQSLGVEPDVIQFVTSQEPDIAKRLVNEVRKNVSLTTEQLQQMVQQISEKQKYQPTRREYALAAPFGPNAPTGVVVVPGMFEWVLLQAKKYRAKKVPEEVGAIGNFPPYEFTYRWPLEHFQGLQTAASMANVLNFIADWARATQAQLSSYDLETAKAASDKWHKEQAKKGEGGGYEEKNVVYALKNGWTIQRVQTENDLEVEGNKMGHCVGSYCEQVYSGASEIYSLRDPKNEPHVTIEVEGGGVNVNYEPPISRKRRYTDPWKVIQIQGKGNQEPVPEYKAMIKEWFQSIGPENITLEGESKDLDDRLYEAEVSQYEGILESYGGENEYGLAGPMIQTYLSADYMVSVYDRIERGLTEQYGKRELTYVPRVMNSIAYSLADLAWWSDMEKLKNVTREEAIDLLKPKAMGERRNTWPELSAIAGIEKVMDKHLEKFDEWNFDSGLKMEDFGSEDEFLEAEAEIRDQEYESWLPGGFDSAILKRWADRVKWDKERGAKGLWPSQLLQEKAESKW